MRLPVIFLLVLLGSIWGCSPNEGPQGHAPVLADSTATRNRAGSSSPERPSPAEPESARAAGPKLAAGTEPQPSMVATDTSAVSSDHPAPARAPSTRTATVTPKTKPETDSRSADSAGVVPGLVPTRPEKLEPQVTGELPSDTTAPGLPHAPPDTAGGSAERPPAPVVQATPDTTGGRFASALPDTAATRDGRPPRPPRSSLEPTSPEEGGEPLQPVSKPAGESPQAAPETAKESPRSAPISARAIPVPVVTAESESLLALTAGDNTPPTPESLARTSGLWSERMDLIPSHDAILLRLSSRERAERILDESDLFSTERKERARTLGARDDSLDGRMRFLSDSLRKAFPPAWEPRLKGQDLVTQQISARAGSRLVEIANGKGDALVEPRVRLNQGEYLKRLTATRFRDIWGSEAKRGLTSLAQAGSRRGIHKLDLPVKLPTQLRGIFGEGTPNLSVRGSERISFGGTSRWNPKQAATEFLRKQSKFPQLDMKQELNLQLTGTIGDKVTVDVDQSSSQSATPLSNRIKIHYKGYDDDILKSVDLGNTSLSLPGTQYVSYGGRAEGLFGINAQAKLGDVDFTTILTKQEGKTESKSVTSSAASSEPHTINDYEYLKGQFFFLRDPNGCPWELDSLAVFVDDRNGNNNQETGALPGDATSWVPADTANAVFTGDFNQLTLFTDYQVQVNIYAGQPVLVLQSPLQGVEALAVAYTGYELGSDLQTRGAHFRVGTIPRPGSNARLRLKMVRPGSASLPSNLTRGVWSSIRNLELKNIYSLGATNILRDGLVVKVQLKGTYQTVVNPDRVGDVTFLRMTGLDLSKLSRTGLSPGHDDLVDTLRVSRSEGLLMFPDLRPFDPDDYDLAAHAAQCNGYGYKRFDPGQPGDNLFEKRPAAIPSELRAAAIYDSLSTTDDWAAESRFQIVCSYRSPVSKIDLNAFGLLPGSEVVTAGGRTLVRDQDYRIDYDSGQVELLAHANVGANDQVGVTYSYIPFAGGGSQTTLAGVAGQYRPEESPFSFSSAWLFQSKGGVPGAEGTRPRLGQEPSRTLVGEFAGNYKGESSFLTRLANAIPGARARAPSQVTMGMGVGLSVPNPNTKNQLYVDDFEGAKEVQSLNMNRLSWRFSSIPISNLLRGTADSTNARAEDHGELWWYSPRTAVHERDLQPNLSRTEGDNNRQVLRMKFFPSGGNEEERRRSWAGVTQVLSNTGVDFSRAQFLDVWVNDFVRLDRDRSLDPQQKKRHGKLVIDLGTVSEDALWYRNDPSVPGRRRVVPPNHLLDREDTPPYEGKLDISDTKNEDVGLDGIKFGEVKNGRPADPFDVYRYPLYSDLPEDDTRQYAQINGTENNQVLDTEDLNGDGYLSQDNSYFQFAVDLSDTTKYMETDVWRDFPGQRSDIADNNGWRRYRIPLADTLIKRFSDGNLPAWTKILHCRVWLTDFPDSTNVGDLASNAVEVGGIEITGNRWFEGPVTNLKDRVIPPDSLAMNNEAFYVGVLNNKEDANYQNNMPPIGLQRQDAVTEREQSITLNFEKFPAGHRASIYRTYPQAQDYTLYRNLQFYLNRNFEGLADSVRFAVRLWKDSRPDTTNYYEYELPVPSSWKLVDIDLATLTRLQRISTTGPVSQDLPDGVTISRRGSPSLTSIGKISFVVTNEGPQTLERGSVWVDELRLTSVKRDLGLASRFSITADVPEVVSLSFNLQKSGADFLTIDKVRGSGTSNTAWNFKGTSNVKNFGGAFGFDIPVSVGLTYSKSVPKFSLNSDLVLQGAGDRDITQSTAQDYSIGLNHKQSRSWLPRYLLDPFSVSGSVRREINFQPYNRESRISRSGTVNWALSLEQWGDLPLNAKTKLRLIPTSLGATLSGGSVTSDRYERTDLTQPYRNAANQDQTTGSLALSAAARPMTPITYRFDSTRDLMQQSGERRLAGLHLGRESSRRHQLTAGWDPPLLRQILNPHLSWSGNSSLNLGQIGGTSRPGEPDRQNSFSNSRTTTAQGRVSLADFLNGVRSIGKHGGKTDSTGAPVPAPVVSPSSQKPGILSLGAINVSYTITTQTSYSGRTGEPDLLYQIALTDAPGRSVRSSSTGATASNVNQKALNLDTTLRLPKQANVTTRYTRSVGTTRSNSQGNETTTLKWPDLDISWGQLHQLIGLNKLFQTFQANTRFSRERQEGTGSRVTDSFAPLLNITASLKSGMSGTLNSSTSSSTETPQGGRTENTTGRRQVTLSVKKTLTLTRKITIPMTSRVQTVQTKVDVNASLDWNASKRETRIIGQPSEILEDRSGWKVQTGLGYQFTQSFSGTGSINFGRDADNKNQVNTANFIGLAFTASFTF